MKTIELTLTYEEQVKLSQGEVLEWTINISGEDTKITVQSE